MNNLEDVGHVSPHNSIYAPLRQKLSQSFRESLTSEPKAHGFILSHISDENPKIQIFANIIKVKVTRGYSVGGGVRSRISNFSKASRKRMLEYMAKIRNYKKAAAITLTYPGIWSPNAELWKRDLATFKKRLAYEYPEVFAIWRLEPQQRGAPHFHIMAFRYTGSLRKFRAWVKAAWFEIVNSGDIKHLAAGTQVDRLKNQKHATWYLAQYTAKPEKWGYQFLTSDGELLKNVGRHWGIHNRAAADDAAYGEYTLTPYQLIQLRRMVVRWQKSRGSDYGRRLARRHPLLGWSVFGLGDNTLGQHRRTIFRMLLAVLEDDIKWDT